MEIGFFLRFYRLFIGLKYFSSGIQTALMPKIRSNIRKSFIKKKANNKKNMSLYANWHRINRALSETRIENIT